MRAAAATEAGGAGRSFGQLLEPLADVQEEAVADGTGGAAGAEGLGGGEEERGGEEEEAAEVSEAEGVAGDDASSADGEDAAPHASLETLSRLFAPDAVGGENFRAGLEEPLVPSQEPIPEELAAPAAPAAARDYFTPQEDLLLPVLGRPPPPAGPAPRPAPCACAMPSRRRSARGAAGVPSGLRAGEAGSEQPVRTAGGLGRGEHGRLPRAPAPARAVAVAVGGPRVPAREQAQAALRALDRGAAQHTCRAPPRARRRRRLARARHPGDLRPHSRPPPRGRGRRRPRVPRPFAYIHALAQSRDRQREGARRCVQCKIARIDAARRAHSAAPARPRAREESAASRSPGSVNF